MKKIKMQEFDEFTKSINEEFNILPKANNDFAKAITKMIFKEKNVSYSQVAELLRELADVIEQEQSLFAVQKYFK